jgi:hypothetical protein
MTVYGRSRNPGQVDPGVIPRTLSDSFNRADNASSLGSTDGGSLSPLAWTVPRGQFGISGGKAYQSGSRNDATNSMLVDIGVPDFDATWTFSTNERSYPGPLFRASAADSGLTVYESLVSSTISLYKRVGPTSNSLVASSASGGPWSGIVRVRAVGTSVKIWVDGTLRLDTTTSECLTQTGIGVSSYRDANGTTWRLDSLDVVLA